VEGCGHILHHIDSMQCGGGEQNDGVSLLGCLIYGVDPLACGTDYIITVPDVVTVFVVVHGEMAMFDLSVVESDDAHCTAGVGVVGAVSWVSGIYFDCCGVGGDGIVWWGGGLGLCLWGGVAGLWLGHGFCG